MWEFVVHRRCRTDDVQVRRGAIDSITALFADATTECLRVLRDADARVRVRRLETSVVWGMPGAVVGAGLADEVLPLDRIAAYLTNRVKTGRSAAVAR